MEKMESVILCGKRCRHAKARHACKSQAYQRPERLQLPVWGAIPVICTNIQPLEQGQKNVINSVLRKMKPKSKAVFTEQQQIFYTIKNEGS